MKKLTVMLLIAAMVLGVSACGNSANKENTATESQMSTQEAEDLDAKINELTQKENSILENHKALWEKVFNSIDKSTVEDATATNYGDFLANSLDKIKDKFTDDELKSLKEDVEEIKKLPGLVQLLLLLRYYDNMTNEETATLLQIPQEAICDSLSRAIHFLRRRLDAPIHKQDVRDALQFAIEQENYPADRIRRLRSDLEKRLMN